MPKFASLISDGMRSRGHMVEVWTAAPRAYNLTANQKAKKWLGYIDQYILFPIILRYRIKKIAADTVFIISDQALGPWVPALANRPHVIHVHDFMALRSALGEFSQNVLSWSGKLYQKFIRRGFTQGKRFISVSKKSENDLHRFLSKSVDESITVYNGLNYPFHKMTHKEASRIFSDFGHQLPKNGFLLHVGGNQWYKNRIGVLEIYSAYTDKTETPKPLIMIGAPPSKLLKEQAQKINNESNGEVSFLVGVPTALVCAAYSTAEAFIFPSVAEGFGWPIIEAMACGCTVLTTNDAPMTEVGGESAVYIPPIEEFQNKYSWAKHCAEILAITLSEEKNITDCQRTKRIAHAQSFDLEKTLDLYEAAYNRALQATTK